MMKRVLNGKTTKGFTNAKISSRNEMGAASIFHDMETKGWKQGDYWMIKRRFDDEIETHE
jgi:hypothetical protein